jgi:hypothetical protein
MSDNNNLDIALLSNLNIETLTTMLLTELANIPHDISFFTSRPTYEIPPDTLESVLTNSFNETSLYKQVICDAELTKLKNSKFKYTKMQDDTCPITQLEFEEQQDIIKLDCNHCFDAEAIIQWLTEEKSECPVCRFTYKSQEIKIVEEDDLQHSRENLYNSLSRVNFNSFLTY